MRAHLLKRPSSVNRSISASSPICPGLEMPPHLNYTNWFISKTMSTCGPSRVVRLYLDNVLIVIKPDRLRYWIRSTAIRDADDTLVDLRRQGY